MIIRRLFSSNNKDKDKKKKSSNKAEILAGGTGLAITAKNLKDDLGYDKGARFGLEQGRFKAGKSEMKEAKEILEDVKALKNPGAYHAPVEGKPKYWGHESHWFNRNYGKGQIEAAENAIKSHFLANKIGYKKIAEKQLNSAEKHAGKAVKLLKDEIASQKLLRNQAAKKMAGKAGAGLALTAGTVAGIHYLKKKKNNDNT